MKPTTRQSILLYAAVGLFLAAFGAITSLVCVAVKEPAAPMAQEYPIPMSVSVDEWGKRYVSRSYNVFPDDPSTAMITVEFPDGVTSLPIVVPTTSVRVAVQHISEIDFAVDIALAAAVAALERRVAALERRTTAPIGIVAIKPPEARE